MAQKDLYEALCRYYEFMLGPLPNRDEFQEALRQTVSEADLRVVFLLPFYGELTIAELERRAAKAGISRERLHEALRRLIPEGIVVSFVRPAARKGASGGYPAPEPLRDLRQEGRVVMRGDLLTMTEMQVRKPEHDPMRKAAANVMDAMIEGRGVALPTRTPYFRVLPFEATLRGEPAYGAVRLDAVLPDPREVLPFDIVSEMVRKEPIIALAECYCRRTKIIQGEGCGHPLETCLYFGDLALLQMEAGRARPITVEEALRVLTMSEEAGLVHNVHNAEGHIGALCNCCTCSCGVMKAILRGQTYAGGPSRFVAAYRVERCAHCDTCVGVCPVKALTASDGAIQIDAVRCIGCGLCVYHCPHGALHMRLRERPPRVFKDTRSLMNQITREALVSLVKQRFTGWWRREKRPSTR